MKKLFRYFKECQMEMKKVVWPTKEYAKNATIIVFCLSALLALFLGLVDYLLLKGIYLIF
ncbi:MAG: preprotein translocase subunit SecE [Sphaerochaetaceae bacterium]|nr:preprotein translocase subunit SecE [Sphaerochaetaceae bacterium]